jgi:ubiquinone/menaquinone biosynthesis C-methylase UbiE
MSPSPDPNPDRIMQMAWGYSAPLILEAALKNRIFDVLDTGPKTAQQVSVETGASERGVRILMNALVGFEFLTKQADGSYALTPESSAFLVSTKPTFQGAFFQHISSQLIPRWMELTEIVRTGKPANVVNERGPGTVFFEQFVEDIFPMSYAAAQRLAQELHLSEKVTATSVLDLATGSGVWGVALAQASPQVHVTAVDWEGVLPVTRRVAGRFGLSERFRFVAGDLLTADFGVDHDVATLGHIIHSEGVERSRALLRKTFQALKSGGTIAIAEFVPNEDRTGPPNALIFAVNMLVNTEIGDTFTFGEMSSWLREAGFVNVRQLEAPAPSPLILATKP